MQLSSQNLSLLLNEVSAMVAANRSIAAGLFELGDRSLGRFGAVARHLSKRLDAGESAESAFASVSGRASSEVSTAFRMLEQVGSAAPIGCVARSIQRRQETRVQLAIAAIYPFLTLFIAYCVVVWVLPWFVLNHFYDDFLGTRGLDLRLTAGLRWLQSNFWIPPLIAIGVGVVWFFAVAPRLGMAGLPGFGRAFREDRWALFCDLMALEIEAGVPMSEAISLAAGAAGDASFRSATVAATTGESARLLPPLLRWTLQRMIPPGIAADGVVSDHANEFRLLADWYRDQAQTRHRFWIEWLPVIAVVAVMLTLILYLLTTMLMPLYSMLSLIGVLS